MSRLPPASATVGALLGVIGIACVAHVRLSRPIEMTAAPAITAAGFERTASIADVGERASRGTLVPRSPNGMFYTQVVVNGRPTRFLVDTGASMIVLSRADAASMGVDLSRAPDIRSIRAVGGQARVNVVRLESLEFAGRKLENLEAAIVEEGVGAPLLGQNALAALDSLTIRGDQMQLY